MPVAVVKLPLLRLVYAVTVAVRYLLGLAQFLPQELPGSAGQVNKGIANLVRPFNLFVGHLDSLITPMMNRKLPAVYSTRNTTRSHELRSRAATEIAAAI